MSVDLSELVNPVKKEIGFEELANKVIAIDAYNTIYQFISIIRQPDGTPLIDNKNRITSHLSGLFYRTINLLEHKIIPIYVFDGIPPLLKQKALEARMSRRESALEAWKEAKEKGLIEEAKLYAMQSAKIDKEIVDSSKELLSYMGIPYIQAPSEGEAEASILAKEGLAYAAATQDYDAFLFGANKVIRNLTITGRRKLPRKNVFINIEIEKIELEELLKYHNINQRQLIWIGILIGNDYNEGIRGIGVKTALKLVRNTSSLDDLIAIVKNKYKKEFDIDIKEVERLFIEPDVKHYTKEEFDNIAKIGNVKKAELIKFMVDEHSFSLDRVEKYIEELEKLAGNRGQTGLGKWIN